MPLETFKWARLQHAGYLRRRYAETGGVQGVVRASVDALRGRPG